MTEYEAASLALQQASLGSTKCITRGATGLGMGCRHRRVRAMQPDRLWTLRHASGREATRRPAPGKHGAAPRNHGGSERSTRSAKRPTSRNHEGSGRSKQRATGTHPPHVRVAVRLSAGNPPRAGTLSHLHAAPNDNAVIPAHVGIQTRRFRVVGTTPRRGFHYASPRS